MDTCGEYLGGEGHEALALDALRQLRPRLDGQFLVDGQMVDGQYLIYGQMVGGQ